jgi:hypothetical protein
MRITLVKKMKTIGRKAFNSQQVKLGIEIAKQWLRADLHPHPTQAHNWPKCVRPAVFVNLFNLF